MGGRGGATQSISTLEQILGRKGFPPHQLACNQINVVKRVGVEVTLLPHLFIYHRLQVAERCKLHLGTKRTYRLCSFLGYLFWGVEGSECNGASEPYRTGDACVSI